MLFTNLLSLAFFASPLVAAPLAPPEATAEQTFDTSIKAVLANVIDNTITLSVVVKGFDGNIQSSGPIITASQGLLDSIVNGTKIVQEAHSLDYIGLLAITGPTLDLNNAVNKVAEAIVSKKPLFEKAGLVPVVLDQLKGQQTAARALVNTLLTKVPLGTVSLGTTLSAPSLEGLDYAISVFSGNISSDNDDEGWGNSTPTWSNATAVPRWQKKK